MKEHKVETISGRSITFTDGSPGGDDKLIIAGFGEDSSGKTRFGMTGPDTVGYVVNDRKSRAVVEKHRLQMDKRILIPKVDFVRSMNQYAKQSRCAMISEAEEQDIRKESMKHYRAHVDMTKEAAWALGDMDEVKMIVLDNAGTLFQDMKFAHYGNTQHVVKRVGKAGKMYQDTDAAKQEMSEFIDTIAHKHLFLTHYAKDLYENDKNTGRKTWQGYPDLGYKVNLQLEFEMNRQWKEGSEEDAKSWHWACSVVKCQANTDIEGENGRRILKDDDIDFLHVAMLVFPDSQPEQWV